jgi:hypothetical protein
MLRLAVVLGVICALISFGAQTASAGTTGMLSGRVYVCDDLSFQCAAPPKQTAPFVKVKITSLSGLGELETTADKNGFFSFVSLTPDRYFVTSWGQRGQRMGCAAFARVSADQLTSANITVLSKNIFDYHCYKSFRPSDRPAWSIGPNGNFEL